MRFISYYNYILSFIIVHFKELLEGLESNVVPVHVDIR